MCAAFMEALVSGVRPFFMFLAKPSEVFPEGDKWAAGFRATVPWEAALL